MLIHSGVRAFVSGGNRSVKKRGGCKEMHVKVFVSFAMKPQRT